MNNETLNKDIPPIDNREEDFPGGRLKDILEVLKKHHITRGLSPVKLREILEDLGPTYVKLGQIMSMRSDMLSEAYCKELSMLRTQVKPLSFDTIISVIEEELGRPSGEIFSKIEPLPLGSASIAQVHMATLSDGSDVVVKVQRPAIKETMSNDIKLLKKAVRILKLTIGTGSLIDFKMVLDELWKTAQEEMNFLQEARNLDLFYKNQKDIVYVTCPQVIHKYTTPRMLVMNYIEGFPIDHTAVLEKQGYDMTEIGEKAAENYCKQILEDGFFHADPHPGNIRISGGQVAWLDLGMTGHLSEFYKQLLRRAILSILKHDIYELKNVLLSLGEAKERINHARLYTDIDDIVSKYVSMDFGNMKLGELIEKLLDMVKEHHIAVNMDITLLGRSMITMEGTLSICSPKVNILQILSAHMSSLLFQELDWKKELMHKGSSIYTSFDKTLDIPAQLSDLLNITKNGQVKINLELPDSKDFLYSIHRMTDRLVLGILAAALFIGSGLICMTDITPEIFHMPWISFAGFSLSGILIFCLLIQIIFRRKK